MGKPSYYKTKQQDTILKYLIIKKSAYYRQYDCWIFRKANPRQTGVTTIYRHLDKLVRQGELQKYIIDGVTSACFQYIGEEAHCHEHFHLKCENCRTDSSGLWLYEGSLHPCIEPPRLWHQYIQNSFLWIMLSCSAHEKNNQEALWWKR